MNQSLKTFMLLPTNKLSTDSCTMVRKINRKTDFQKSGIVTVQVKSNVIDVVKVAIKQKHVSAEAILHAIVVENVVTKPILAFTDSTNVMRVVKWAISRWHVEVKMRIKAIFITLIMKTLIDKVVMKWFAFMLHVQMMLEDLSYYRS